jgi:amino acid adenylation domain-containing protein
MSLPHYVHRLFESQARRTPAAPAALFAEAENVRQLSYGQLDRRANQLAHYLQRLGIGPDVMVAVVLERSLDIPVALLAVLKAGGAYVPVDPSHPPERLAYILQDTGARVLLSQQHLLSRLPAFTGATLCLHRDWPQIVAGAGENAADEPPVVSLQPENLAYTLYTSGTTGRPKGVLIPHRALANHSQAMAAYYQLTATDRVLQFASLSFDVAAEEMFPTWIRGATLVFRSGNQLLSFVDFDRFLAEQQITIANLPTAYWHVWTLELARHQSGLPPHLRLVITGTEKAFAATLEKWRSLAGSHVRWINAYGPTETTVTVMAYEPGPDWAPADTIYVPIGRPVANSRIYLLDESLKQVAPGEVGELYVGGPGLARGYLNDPAATAARFVAHPFGAQPGERLYRTGDLARILPDGNVEILGRVDFQVKIRGFRVEPEEVEQLLVQHPAVQEAVVVTHEEAPGDMRLAAYIVRDRSYAALENHVSKWKTRQVQQWRSLYDDLYQQPAPTRDPTFNIVGWESSYTGQPIPEVEMHEWITQTVERILTTTMRSHGQAPRVLEIGCGTGLLLLRLAPHTSHYLGTDFSETALATLRRQLHCLERPLPQVELQQRTADDFSGIEPGSFDQVIINSVAQYFPDVDYLLEVVAGAVAAVRPGGRIFIGDVRNLALLDAFHASVQLYQAPDSLAKAHLKQLFDHHLLRDGELVLDPELFAALPHLLPRISHVETQLKRGRYLNELTLFRYDVTLYVADDQPRVTPERWFDWEKDQLSLTAVGRLLAQPRRPVVALRQVPNARLAAPVKTATLLRNSDVTGNVAALRREVAGVHDGIDPESFWQLAGQFSYSALITWSGRRQDGAYDVVLRPCESAFSGAVVETALTAAARQPKSWRHYSNNPLHNWFLRRLAPQLRTYLAEKVPGYMIPSAFILLEALPLNAAGKVDRQALPVPDATHAGWEDGYTAPRNAVEEILVTLWQEVLNLEEVGIHDNFFQLGGHSLMAAQLVSRLRKTLLIHVPLPLLFETPTVATLAERLPRYETERGQLMARAQQIIAGKEGFDLAEFDGIPRRDQQDTVPLSFAQQRLWFLEQLQPGNPTYNVPLLIRLEGPLQPCLLAQALTELVRRHEAVRTTFPTLEGEPVQRVQPATDVDLPLVDLRSLAAAAQEEAIRQLVEQEGRRLFDLAQGPLLRAQLLQLDPAAHALLLCLHHIICDGWSLGLLVEELAALYGAQVAKQPSRLPDLPIQYPDFALWQRQWFQGAVREQHWAYWRDQLQGEIPALSLPTDRPRSPDSARRGATYRFVLPRRLARSLKSLSEEQECTLFMTLLAAFSLLLFRYTGQTDIAIGSVTANRTRSETEPLIGFFVNTLALRVDLAQNPTFLQLLERVRCLALGAFDHQDFPFEQLVAKLRPDRPPGQQPLFQVMFALQSAPLRTVTEAAVTFRPLVMANDRAKFDLSLDMDENEAGLTGIFEYDTALFDAATIERMAGHLQTLLAAVAAGPQQHIGDFPLLTDGERQQILVEWNRTAVPYPSGELIHQLIACQAEMTPEATAVIGNGEQLTYAELNMRANQLAHYLQSLGVGPESVVALHVERSVAMITALLAVLKAGGAYTPLDPTYPTDRLAFMLADCGAAVLLTRQSLAEQLPPPPGVTTVNLDNVTAQLDRYSRQNPVSHVGQENLAYIIYTSGSTGQPKGVMVPHGALLNFSRYAAGAYDLATGDRVLQFASLSFDTAVEEIYPCLMHGATLALRNDEMLASTVAFWRTCRQWGITVLDLPTAYWHSLAAELSEYADLPETLRLVIIGGEQALLEPWQRWRRIVGRRVRLVNTYGPTETTVIATLHDLTPTADMEPTWEVPIGRPIANSQVYILDQQGQLAPPGVAGMLYVGGAGLARGYWRQPDLTAERFVSHPFDSRPGARLYCTGDLARYTAEGNLIFLGRADEQVKIRGFRVEPAEIEQALSQHAYVREAAVVVREQANGSKELLAYFTALTTPPTKALTDRELRSFLAEKVPDYMIPARFVQLDNIPLTPGGKIDRRNLPEPGVASLATGQEWAAPRDQVELRLTRIWQKVLDTQAVGIHDNFFELGGHSLLAVRLMALLRQEFGRELPLSSLFRNSTIAAMAANLRRNAPFMAATPLVAIQPEGCQPPLFCPHPVGGNVLCYVRLAHHLGSDQPVYGLQYPGLEDEYRLDLSVAEMAQHYIEAMRTVQAQGPYYLAGWSFGGVVAFEMACQLQRGGERVALLALLDSWAPVPEHKSVGFDDATSAFLFTKDLGARAGKNLPVSIAKLAALASDKQLRYILEVATHAQVLPPEMDLATLQMLLQVHQANSRAFVQYNPGVYAGAILLLRSTELFAEEFAGSYRDPGLGWTTATTESVVIQPVPGDHITMLTDPHVATLAGHLKTYIVPAAAKVP